MQRLLRIVIIDLVKWTFGIALPLIAIFAICHSFLKILSK